MEGKIINELINTKLWKLTPKRSYENPNFYNIYSDMKGYSSGRYRMEITKLLRSVDGNKYKVSIYWTPYNPFDLKFKGRFNTYDDLVNIINTVNKDLLDVSRVYN